MRRAARSAAVTHIPHTPHPQPTSRPTHVPSPLPTLQPSAVPLPGPTARPSPQPTSRPSAVPTSEPTPGPTPRPTSQPSPVPSPQPTGQPTPLPSPRPTGQPTPLPSPSPSFVPSPVPTTQACAYTYVHCGESLTGYNSEMGNVAGEQGRDRAPKKHSPRAHSYTEPRGIAHTHAPLVRAHPYTHPRGITHTHPSAHAHLCTHAPAHRPTRHPLTRFLRGGQLSLRGGHYVQGPCDHVSGCDGHRHEA